MISHRSSAAVASLLLILSCLVLLSGCNEPETDTVDNRSAIDSESNRENNAGTEDASSPEANSDTDAVDVEPIEEPAAVGDDPAAIAELESLGVEFTLNDDGQVTRADCKAAAFSDEQALKLVQFTQLADLSLENAGVTDAGLDAVLSQMPQIKILSLRRCNLLTDAGFAALGKLPTLERALLLYTNISNDGLAHLAPLTQLRVLDLRGCVRIGNAGMAHLAGLVNLVDLKLRCTGLYDTGVAQLAGLTKLRSLSLEDGRVTDAGTIHLAEMTDLRQLNLNRTAVTDACFQNFTGMTQLQDLRLRGTSARGPGLDAVADSVVDSLTFLELSENRLTDDDLSHVARFVNLKTLDLWASTVTDAGLVHLAGMHQIEDLNLDGCPVTSAGISQLANLTTLKVLNLSRTQIDDAALDSLTALTNLTQLSIENVTNITPEAVARFQEALPNCTIKR